MRVPLPQVQANTQQTPQAQAGGVAPLLSQRSNQVAQAGTATRQLGEVAVGIAAMLRDEADTAAAKEAHNKFAGRLTEMLEHPETGYLNTIGKAAVGDARSRFLTDAETVRREIEKGLGNEVQKGAFGEAASRYLLAVKSKVYGHEATQRRAWNIGETRAMAEQAVRDAIEMAVSGEVPNDVVQAGELAAQDDAGPDGMVVPETPDRAPPTAQSFLNAAVTQQHELADLMGFPADSAQRRAMVEGATEAIHLGVIERLLSQDRTKEAATYFGKVPKGQMTGEARGKVEATIARATRADRAFALGNEIIDQVLAEGLELDFSKAAQPGASPTTTMLRQADAELRARFERGDIDAQERDAAMSRVREAHALMLDEWNATARDTMLEAERFFANNPEVRSTDSPSFPKILRERLIEYGLADSASRLGGGKGTDPAIYRQMLADADAGAMAGMSQEQLFVRYYAGLGPTEWNDAQRLHKEANGDRKPLPNDDFFDFDDQALAIAQETGIITGSSPDGMRPRPKGDAEVMRLGQWKGTIQAKFNAARQNLKRDLTTNEKLEIVRSVSTDKVYEPQSFLFDSFNPDDHRWSWEILDPKAQEQAYLESTSTGEAVRMSEIPEAAVHDVTDAFRLERVRAVYGDNVQGQVLARLRELGVGRVDASPEQLAVRREAVTEVWRSLGLLHVQPPRQMIVDHFTKSREKYVPSAQKLKPPPNAPQPYRR